MNISLLNVLDCGMVWSKPQVKLEKSAKTAVGDPRWK